MQANYFKWLNVPEKFNLNLSDLKNNYLELSKKTHPDNFYHKSDFEKQLAQKALAYTHQAYEVLSCPIKRASYILFLNQIDLNSEEIERQPMTPDFLSKIFDWQMQEKSPKLYAELQESIQAKLALITSLFSENQFHQAVMLVREILFIQKILESS
jgi:molecular chaperone HscB